MIPLMEGPGGGGGVVHNTSLGSWTNPLEVGSHYREPQLQFGENYSYLFIWDQTFVNLDVETVLLITVIYTDNTI